MDAIALDGVSTIENKAELNSGAVNYGVSLASHAVNGSPGNDILTDSTGQDVLSGGAGADTFTFRAANLDAKVIIADFHPDEGDALHIADLLIGYHPATSAIADFVSFTSSNGNTVMSVDRDGDGIGISQPAGRDPDRRHRPRRA